MKPQKSLQYIEDLVAGLSNGDYFAFARFYDHYYDKVYQFARYFTKSEDVCKEVVSDVFFGIWSSRKSIGEIQNLDNYLFISIKNQILKHQRNNKKINFDTLEEIPVDKLIEIESPENIFISDELKQLIETSIQNLPPKCRTVFLLIREEGLKYREVAELLSISEKTVQNHMIVAVKKIVETIRSTFPDIDTPRALVLFLSFFEKKGGLH